MSMMTSFDGGDDHRNIYETIEAKRQKNLEDNRRFLAALKINDIRNEIKDINRNEKEGPAMNSRRNAKKDILSNRVRRSSRIRKNYGQKENIPSKKTKKTTEQYRIEKVKLELPEHMLTRYHSTGKKIALHNSKFKFGDDLETDNLLF